MKKSDGCTWFPDKWITWKFKIIDIHDICVKHDENCGSTGFYKNLWKNRIVGAVIIATVASIACWIKYPKKMIKKV